jgi:hypothetical protein
MYLLAVKKALSIFCTCTIIVSMGMHALQVKHSHYGELNSTDIHATGVNYLHKDAVVADTHSDSAQPASSGKLKLIEDKMHMAEKKMFLLILAAFVLLFSFRQLQMLAYRMILAWGLIRMKNAQTVNPSILYSYMCRLYASGILNPKLH